MRNLSDQLVFCPQMKRMKRILLLLSVFLIFGSGFPDLVSGLPDDQIITTPARYNFNWNVRDGRSNNDFGQSENRDGDVTQGSYYVLLPDGRTQKVSYTVDAYSGRTLFFFMYLRLEVRSASPGHAFIRIIIEVFLKKKSIRKIKVLL